MVRELRSTVFFEQKKKKKQKYKQNPTCNKFIGDWKKIQQKETTGKMWCRIQSHQVTAEYLCCMLQSLKGKGMSTRIFN